MFEIRKWRQGYGNYYLKDKDGDFLHSDGQIYHHAAEYWPTRALAQTVLDKYLPPHVWKHGDVFRRSSGTVMVYIVVDDGPIVYCVYPSDNFYPDYHPGSRGDLNACLLDATFLFNIKEKL